MKAETVVVGNGMFGSAAVRHLAARGRSVVGIGAAANNPDHRKSADLRWPAHRVYSSHNDAARLTRRQDRNAAWAAVTERAIGNYRRLEQESGVAFFHDVGCLIVSRPGGGAVNNDPRLVMDETNVEYFLYEPGDKSWQDLWPALSLPETHYVAHEPAPAGYILPKRLIEAQNVLAQRAGAQLIVDTVIAVSRTLAGFTVETAAGLRVEADRVLITAGAFSNFNDLLPRPLDITVKSEVIVLGEVTHADAIRLGTYPTVKYLIDSGDLEGIYMVPPVRYEDGRSFIKMGANTTHDSLLNELAHVQRWFASDTDGEFLPLFEPVLRGLWPGLDFLSMHTQPCVITRTANSFPIIDCVSEGLYVATAGNGGGAKGSDAWGELAADLIESG